MPSIQIVATSRAVFRAPYKTLRFTPPADVVVPGDMLVAIAWGDSEVIDTGAPPAGWTSLAAATINPGASGINFYYYGHPAARTDPDFVDFGLQPAGSVTHEWNGILLVVRGGTPQVIELVAGGAFNAGTWPLVTLNPVQQASDIVFGVYTVAGAFTVTAPPTGFALIDQQQTKVIAQRSWAAVQRQANEVGGLVFPDATASGAAVGADVAIALRAGPPVTPATLYDPVPGNIGLLGKDQRAPREVQVDRFI